MLTKRLDINIPAQLKSALQTQAEGREVTLTDIVTQYLQEGINRANGLLLEQRGLPLIQEVLQIELSKLLVQIRHALQEDRLLLLSDLKRLESLNDNRLSALVVRSLREIGATHLLLLYLSETLVSQSFSQVADERAAKEISQKLTLFLQPADL